MTTTIVSSERNLVVHVVALAAGAGHRRLALAWRGGRPGRAEVAIVGPCSAAGAVEHGQRRVEALQHDLGRVAVLAVLVLPFARLQRAFEINLRAFLEVLLGNLGEALAADDDAMPFGLLAPFAGCLVAPAFRGRDPQIDDRAAVLSAADFGVGAQIADENDLVDAACHRSLSIHFPFHPTPGSPEVRGCRASRPHLSP